MSVGRQAAALGHTAGEVEVAAVLGVPGRSKKKAMSQDEQRATLAAFGRGGFPVPVASSVGEEGIDIPAVDLVVFFEAVRSY